MTATVRLGSVALLAATATLLSGCGGSGSPKALAAEQDAAAAAASASADIAALDAQLSKLTATPPAPATSAPAPAAAPSTATATVATASVAPGPGSAAPTSPAPTSAAAPPAATSAPAAASAAVTSAAGLSLPAGASAALAALGPSAGAVLGLISTLGDVSKQCAAIPIAQVQALVKAKVGPAANEPLQCGWKGTDLQVSLSPNDTGHHSYTDLVSTEGHPLPGLGDVAQWFQPINGTTPDVNSYKGSLTCYVQGVGDLPDSTLPYTGKDPFFATKLSDAKAYALKEAKLCADIYAVSKT